MPISPNFTSIYTRSFIVDFFDCSPDGVIKLSALSRLIQYVASEHSIVGGISFWDLQQVSQAWVVNKFRIEIEGELPHWQDEITITTWIEKLDGFRSVRNFEVHQNGQLLANASSLWVIMNTEKRRPELMKLPHEHFIKYADKKSVKEDFQRMPKNIFSKLSSDKVKYSDLDMVNHVTNIKYIEWIMDTAYAHNIDLKGVKTLDMLFKKEMTYDLPYDILYSVDKEGHHFTVNTNEDTVNFYCYLN
ncbi:thioesterase [Myroides albus]|uniref:acyl-[acyl-carrier-protein] thioesterase n=1 Tax=Myroides albus TaxID=2562892 RepID=UPI0021590C53|nr:acyl-ACP thioesterase domain-containing protein [Myroides albus]UVD79638.1 thioesterase [Myroides albus]